MMFFAKKAPVADAGRHPLPHSEQRVAKPAAKSASPRATDAARGTDEGASVEPTCALWHDIARALEAKPKGAK